MSSGERVSGDGGFQDLLGTAGPPYPQQFLPDTQLIIYPTARSENHDHLQQLIDAWPATPALILDERLDAGWNHAYRDTLLDPAAVAEERRNLLLLLIGELQHAVSDWPLLVRSLYGQFRTATDHLPDDPRVGDLRRLLAAERPDLAHRWQCRSVSDFAPTTLAVRGVQMTLSMLRPASSGDAFVLVHALADTPRPSTASAGSST